MFIGETSGVSYNQPIFCPNATWNPNATTFANISIIGSNPCDMFITTNNIIYMTGRSYEHIIIWNETSSIPIRDISLNSTFTRTVFVTTEGNIYFDYTWNSITGINKWTLNSSNNVSIMETCSDCYDIFIDISNNIYCSLDSNNQVIKRLLNNQSNPVEIVAGTGIAGSTAYMLNCPTGLFVDTNFDLYVADCYSNRVQLFLQGQSNAVTVADNGSSPATISLYNPTGITLDANNYLFIADYLNNRIVRGGPNGFQCLLGCYGSGSAAYQFYGSRSLSFDSFGNIFVVDKVNNQIQKFLLMTNSCNETTASPINNVTYVSANGLNIQTVNSTNNISYNQPKLDQYAVWNPNGITFVDNSTVGLNPYGIFINTNNTIYVPDRQNSRLQIWINGDINSVMSIYTNPIYSGSIFVTANGDIYTDDQNSSYQVSRWISNTNNSAVVMNIDGGCYGLFVDINNTLYCSVRYQHKVLAKPLSIASNLLTRVAGTGCNGSNSNTLNQPNGIFVDDNFDLYVADANNNRIQLFPSGQQNGITVAGNGSLNMTIILNYPIDVVLDIDKNLYIVDNQNYRIVGSGPNGFRCIIGCTGLSGSTSNTLLNPTSMAFDSYGNIYVVDQGNIRIQKFILLNNTLVPSYNQPKFCPNATWSPNATTFANNITIGSNPYALFINTNDTIYAASYQYGQILIWLNNNINPNITIYSNLSSPKSIFVTINGDLYVDNSDSVNRVVKSISYTNMSTPIMNINSSCMGLFVDISNTLYCSIDVQHKVFKKWLNDNTSIWTTVAGTGSSGSASNMLNYPNGIFVDTNFDLYVADCWNNRIQLFRLGELNGITVAGNTSANITITLYHPANIILDGNKYLFFTDRWNHRIIGSDVNDFRCIVGCTGSSANQLNRPRTIAFDSFGNLYVADQNNDRIQKFILTSSCHEMATQQSILTSTSIKETTVVLTTSSPSSVAPNCPDQNTIGTNCNISSNPCAILKPCQNNGTCLNTTTNILGYICACALGFNGTQCEYDHRPCQPTTCWNNGICNETSNTTFECFCQLGWTSEHCELMINFCENIRCENEGEGFSGRHCEIVSMKLVVRQFVSKSLAYVAIIIIASAAAIFVIMDLLKYCFGIDSMKGELERIQRAKVMKRVRRRPVIQRFIYVNASPAEQQRRTAKTRKKSIKTEETIVLEKY